MDWIRQVNIGLENPSEYWTGVKAFLSCWHPDLTAADGISQEETRQAENKLGFALPAILKDWYQLVGKRKEIVATQNYLVPPEKLLVRAENILVFYLENQAINGWGIRIADLNLPNPPVMVNLDYAYSIPGLEKWQEENSPLSKFIFRAVVLETVMAAKIAVNGPIKESVQTIIEGNFERVMIPAWYWPKYPIWFYANASVLIAFHENGWVYVGALDEMSLGKVKDLIPAEWVY